jgi:large subunit ribosomal protein L6e
MKYDELYWGLTQPNTIFNTFYLGPYVLNGVPLRRVNQRYVIATSTKVPVDGVDSSSIDDEFFAREKAAKKPIGEEVFLYLLNFALQLTTPHLLIFDIVFRQALFDASTPKVTVTSPARLAAQAKIDGVLKTVIDKVDKLSSYLGAKFSLSKADKPHLLKF